MINTILTMIIVVLSILTVIKTIKLIIVLKNKNKENTTVIFNQAGYKKHIPNKSTENIDSYKSAYKKRYLLTINEKTQFEKIANVTQKLNLLLFTKVRLADIVEPANGAKNWKTLFYKIQAKHVDFLICDKSIRPICVLEIDDNSHERNDRQKRDEFVDYILKDVGIETIRKRNINETDLENEITRLKRIAPLTTR